MTQEAPRASEPFPRVYSPPEPPARPRRGNRKWAVAVVVAAGVAAAGVLLFAPGPSSAGHGQASATAQAGPTQAGAPVQPAPQDTTARYATAPRACTAPDGTTLDRLLPGGHTAQPRPVAGQAKCQIVSNGAAVPSLTVETDLYNAGNSSGLSPAAAARHYFTVDLSTANHPGQSQHSVLVTTPKGLGEQAFGWAFQDQAGSGAINAEVEVRDENAVVIVVYTQSPRAGEAADAAARRLLDDAAAVATDVLQAYA